MKKKNIILLLITTIVFHLKGNSQDITTPSEVYAGETVNLDLSLPTRFTTYTWSINNTNISPIFNGVTAVSGTGVIGNDFAVCAQSTMVYDTVSNKYYAFVNSANSGSTTGSIQRLDFGSNPNGTPTVSDLGNPFSLLYSTSGYRNLEAIEFALDDEGIFHAFITNGGIVHYKFGNGLDNLPTYGKRIYNHSSVVMPMQLVVKNYEGSWSLFFGNAFGSNVISRIDLGSNLNSLPTTLTKVDLPTPSGGFGAYPAYFSIARMGKDWFMLVKLCGPHNTYYRYRFGTNLRNNAPLLTSYSVSTTQDIRGVNILMNKSNFYAATMNRYGYFGIFDFDNNIISAPTFSYTGTPYTGRDGFQMMKPYWYNGTLYGLTSSWQSNLYENVFRIPMTQLTDSGQYIHKYYSPKATFMFTEPGEYKITLFCDQGDPAGPEVFEKRIIVKQGQETSIQDEMIKNSLNIFPNPASSFINVSLNVNTSSKISKIKILDIQGKEFKNIDLLVNNANSMNHQIDISDIKAGSYYMVITIDGINYTKTFTKL